MRIWSLHPRYLDRQALVACWRETLLAQAVLSGTTRGYKNHPQLARFKQASDPVALVGSYLEGVADEAEARGYRFDRSLIRRTAPSSTVIDVTDGQLALEWQHLMAKLAARSPEMHERWRSLTICDPHPLLRCVPGPVESWERATSPAS